MELRDPRNRKMQNLIAFSVSAGIHLTGLFALLSFVFKLQYRVILPVVYASVGIQKARGAERRDQRLRLAAPGAGVGYRAVGA